MPEDREATRPLARRDALDTPLEARRPLVRPVRVDPERFGRLSEGFARFMGTPRFLLGMTVFVTLWLAWNTIAPEASQFDPEALNYTLLTLILSLQASYAAPLILLAQNRQDDRDRVSLEQDRQRAERNLADTEYLAREVAALRIAMGEVATRDFLRSELRALLGELERADEPTAEGSGEREGRPERKKKGSRTKGEDGPAVAVETPLPGARAEPVLEPRGARRLELHPDG